MTDRNEPVSTRGPRERKAAGSCEICRELREEIDRNRELSQRLIGLPGQDVVDRVARRLARRAALHAFCHLGPLRDRRRPLGR